METHMIFETHAHYDDEAFEQDREALLNSMEAHGIGHIVNACASIESLKATEELMEKYPFVYGAFGIHPDDAEKMTEDTLNEIRRLCHLPKAVAIGEIGLDYYWHREEREHEIQKKMFRAQMEIAREEKMPFMIHSRDAARDTLELVKECMKEGMHGGIIHCFSYGKEMAREYLNMGLYLGIGGVVTFKNAKKLKEVVEYAPLEQLVLETDSPYLGSRSSTVWPPASTAPASCALSAPPRSICASTSSVIPSASASGPAGKNAMFMAHHGSPPMAYTSERALAAAICPNI